MRMAKKKKKTKTLVKSKNQRTQNIVYLSSRHRVFVRVRARMANEREKPPPGSPICISHVASYRFSLILHKTNEYYFAVNYQQFLPAIKLSDISRIQVPIGLQSYTAKDWDKFIIIPTY